MRIFLCARKDLLSRTTLNHTTVSLIACLKRVRLSLNQQRLHAQDNATWRSKSVQVEIFDNLRSRFIKA